VKTTFSKAGHVRQQHLLILAAASVCLLHTPAQAQGILSVRPGRTAQTTAGTGTPGYTGESGAATAATLANPSAVAYDGSGNLFIADANNHVIRELVQTSGKLITVAGTGVAGFGGDGGPATSALLDTPSGIAIDASGNIFFADSHNHRIRAISGGTIKTIAGTGSAGFSGDNGQGAAAQLALPSAIALDTSGNLFVADTNNNRIRKIAGGTITTVAGNGDEFFAGDGGPAISASLDLPAGVAVDSSGNLYIADRHNQRVRVVAANGVISTVAGSADGSIAGGFSGDGGDATAAALSKPTGIAVDRAGNLYIADTNNHRIRQVASGAIATVAGTGDEGFGGDGSDAAGALLDSPKGLAIDGAGDVSLADSHNQRVRLATLPTLTFPSTTVGTTTAGQSVTLANTGSASLVVTSVSFTGPFTVVSGGTCPAAPVSLAAGTSCTENIAFAPTASGSASGSVTFGGNGLVSQRILFSGLATQASTSVALTSSATTAFTGQSVTLTATVTASGSNLPSGTVTFYDGTTVIGTGNVANGTASLTTTQLATGTRFITAVFAGNAAFTGSTSPALSELIEDFALALSSGSSGVTSEPGETAVVNLNVASADGPFGFPVTLSASGLPAGATAIFSPPTLTPGSGPTNVQLRIQTPSMLAAAAHHGVLAAGLSAFALLLLPFSDSRRRTRGMQIIVRGCVLVLSVGAVAGLSGCASGSGFFGQPQKSYIVTITATATGSNGATLQRSTNVTLVIQ
jgi:sugar lactone lactonase YvrE